MVRCAASRSPITPSAPSSIAALNSTAPTISDWMWPATPPPVMKSMRKRTKNAKAATPITSAPPQNTFSGSYWE